MLNLCRTDGEFDSRNHLRYCRAHAAPAEEGALQSLVYLSSAQRLREFLKLERKRPAPGRTSTAGATGGSVGFISEGKKSARGVRQQKTSGEKTPQRQKTSSFIVQQQQQHRGLMKDVRFQLSRGHGSRLAPSELTE